MAVSNARQHYEAKYKQSGSVRLMFRWVSAEFLSTLFLIFFGCSACLPIPGLPQLPQMYSPFAFGITVIFITQAFGHTSGAHINPAVSIAAFLWGKLTFSLTIAYIIAQVTGAILGYYILTLIADTSSGVCKTLVRENMTATQAYGMEFLLTGSLVLVLCSFWDSNKKQESLPLIYGISVAGLLLAGGPSTGASLNPARSLAPAIFTGKWEKHWVYWLGPITGAIAATILYRCLSLKGCQIKRRRNSVELLNMNSMSKSESDYY